MQFVVAPLIERNIEIYLKVRVFCKSESPFTTLFENRSNNRYVKKCNNYCVSDTKTLIDEFNKKEFNLKQATKCTDSNSFD